MIALDANISDILSSVFIGLMTGIFTILGVIAFIIVIAFYLKIIYDTAKGKDLGEGGIIDDMYL